MGKCLKKILQNTTVLAVHIIKSQAKFCLLNFNKDKKITLKFSVGSSDDSIGIQINKAINASNFDRIIIGYSNGILGAELDFPPLKKSLLNQSVRFQLEELYPFFEENLTCAYHILEKSKTGLTVQGFVATQACYDNFVTNLSDLDSAIDMLTTVEIVGKRLSKEMNFYKEDKLGYFTFQTPALEELPLGWQEQLPDNLEKKQVGELLLALYGASHYLEKDKKNWFVLPKYLVKTVLVSKVIFFVCIAFFMISLIIFIVDLGKSNFNYWQKNQLFLDERVKQNDKLKSKIKEQKENQLISEEIIATIQQNNNLDKGSIIISLTKLLPTDYFITNLHMNNTSVTCNIEAKSTNIMKPQIYEAFLQEDKFVDLQISDISKGKYFLRFSINKQKVK